MKKTTFKLRLNFPSEKGFFYHIFKEQYDRMANDEEHWDAWELSFCKRMMEQTEKYKF